MPEYNVRDKYGRKIGSVDHNPARGELAELLFLGVIFGIWAAVSWWVRTTIRRPTIMLPIHLLIVGGILLLVNLPSLLKPPVSIVRGDGSTHVSWNNGSPQQPVILARANSASVDPNSKPGDILSEETVELPAGTRSYDWTWAEGGSPGAWWCYRLKYGDNGAWTPYTCS